MCGKLSFLPHLRSHWRFPPLVLCYSSGRCRVESKQPLETLAGSVRWGPHKFQGAALSRRGQLTADQQRATIPQLRNQ